MPIRRNVSAVVVEAKPGLSPNGFPQIVFDLKPTDGSVAPPHYDVFSTTEIKKGPHAGQDLTMEIVLVEAYIRRMGLAQDATILDIHAHLSDLVGQPVCYNSEDVIINGAVKERIKSLWFQSDPPPERKLATADEWAKALA